jgi:hypothetical protein
MGWLACLMGCRPTTVAHSNTIKNKQKRQEEIIENESGKNIK